MKSLVRTAVKNNLITPQMMQRDPLWLHLSAYAHNRMPHELEADLDWLDSIKKRAADIAAAGRPYRNRAEVYAMKDGKILTGLINDSFMTFGGGVDDGEDLVTAAGREVEEETGYPVANLRPLGPPVVMEYSERPIPAGKMSPKQKERRAQYRGDRTQFFLADVTGEPTKAVDPSKAKQIDFRDIPTLRGLLAKVPKTDAWAKHHLARFDMIEQASKQQQLIRLLQQQLAQRSRQNNGLEGSIRQGRMAQA